MEGVRLDIWLDVACLARTRSQAKELCDGGKVEVNGRMVWVWNTAPGEHDFGDCMTMLYVGAAFGGIGTGAITARPARKKYSQADLSRAG